MKHNNQDHQSVSSIASPSLKINLSPERQAAHKQIGGRIIQENEAKLAQALEENENLKELYE